MFASQVVGNPKAKHLAKKSDGDDESESDDEEDSSSDEEETKDEDEKMDHDGEKSDEDDEEIPETPADVPAKLTFLPVEENIKDRSITDIREFKDKLKLYPMAKLF